MKPPSEMSLSELREVLEYGENMKGLTLKGFVDCAREYARRTADIVESLTFIAGREDKTGNWAVEIAKNALRRAKSLKGAKYE